MPRTKEQEEELQRLLAEESQQAQAPSLTQRALGATFPLMTSIEPKGPISKTGRIIAGVADVATIPQRLGGVFVGQKFGDPSSGIFTAPFKKKAAEIRKEGEVKGLKSQQFVTKLQAGGLEVLGETLSDPLTFTGVGAPFVAGKNILRRLGGKPVTKGLRKLGAKKLLLGGKQVTFEGSDELAASIQKTEDLLSPAQREGLTRGLQPELESQFTMPGGQAPIQEQRLKLRDQFVNDLLPKVEKEISPNTAGLTLERTVEKLDNIIDVAQKKQKTELGKRFGKLHEELADLPVIGQGGPPNLKEIKQKVDAFLFDKGVVTKQGGEMKFNAAFTDVANKKVFNEFQDISESLVGEGVVSFDKLRIFRANQRNLAKTAAKQGDNRAASEHNEMAGVISDYMQEVAERAGRGGEFKRLDQDWASFKTVTDKIKKILEKPVEQQAEKILQLSKKDKDTLFDILEQNPDAREAIRGIIFKSLKKKASSFKEGEKVINLDRFLNLKEQLGDEGFINIFGGKNNALVNMVLDIGTRGKVFKDVELVLGGPMSRFASVGTRPLAFGGAKLAQTGLPGFVRKQFQKGAPLARTTALGSRFADKTPVVDFSSLTDFVGKPKKEEK